MVSGKSLNQNQRDDVINKILGGDLSSAIPGLGEYFALGSIEGLITQLIDVGAGQESQSELAQAMRDAIGSDPVTPLIRRVVLDVVKGAYTTRDLIDELQRQLAPDVNAPLIEESVDLRRTFLVFGDERVANVFGTPPINDVLRIKSDSSINSGAPSKATPGLAAYVVKPIGITPGVKNTGALSLFMNAIPTTEFSRAVPYVELVLQVGRTPLTDDGRLNSPSQLKFVLGAARVNEGSADRSIASSAAARLGGDAEALEDATTALSGMELFLSPQTLVPVGTAGFGFDEINGPTLRSTPVLDPFRPLASLDSVTIDVAASTGFMSFKTAKVELTLYDRSRLHELADLVKPDLYSQTEFLLEYGWSHPDGLDYERNPFGALLNATRKREKYGIVNSSFQFADDGTVKIVLQLAMKGANEYRTTQIGSDEAVQGALREIHDLQERIAEIRSAINSTTFAGARGNKSVFAEQILESAQTTNGNPTITPKQARKLKSIIARLRKVGASGNERALELADTLKELYIEGPGGEKSAVERLQTSVARVIEERFEALDGLSPTKIAESAALVVEDTGKLVGGESVIDPFIDLAHVTIDDLKARGKSKFVSFGKVFMKFIAEPIAATHKFDEVQVLFYPLNNNAGAARNRSVASILIERERLKREFETFVLERRGAAITVGEFQNFINQTFIDNVANVSYGVATLYREKRDKDGVVRFVPNYSGFRGRDKRDLWATELEQKLLNMGVPNGVFKPPHVDIYIETIPARTPRGAEGELRDLRDDATILRIHVFDKVATAYESQGELIRAMADDQLNTIGFIERGKNDDEGRQLEAAKRIVEAADRLNLIERIPDDAAAGGDRSGPVARHFRIVGGPRALKKFVMSTAPYIIYGAQNTAVTSLGLTSIQDPALSTVNMLRTDRAGSITPEGSGKGGVPLKTIPAKLSVTSLGCPLIDFMQQFFVDAQTGTDLDNIYAVTQLSHMIDAQGFKTSFEMVPQQAYGKYESTLNKVEQALGELEHFVAGVDSGR